MGQSMVAIMKEQISSREKKEKNSSDGDGIIEFHQIRQFKWQTVKGFFSVTEIFLK